MYFFQIYHFFSKLIKHKKFFNLFIYVFFILFFSLIKPVENVHFLRSMKAKIRQNSHFDLFICLFWLKKLVPESTRYLFSVPVLNILRTVTNKYRTDTDQYRVNPYCRVFRTLPQAPQVLFTFISATFSGLCRQAVTCRLCEPAFPNTLWQYGHFNASLAFWPSRILCYMYWR